MTAEGRPGCFSSFYRLRVAGLWVVVQGWKTIVTLRVFPCENFATIVTS